MKTNTSKQLQDFIDKIFAEKTGSKTPEISPANPTKSLSTQTYEQLQNAMLEHDPFDAKPGMKEELLDQIRRERPNKDNPWGEGIQFDKDLPSNSNAEVEKFEALRKALDFFKKQNANNSKLQELMENKPSESEVEQNIAKSAKSFPSTPHVDQVAEQRAQKKFNKLMENSQLLPEESKTALEATKSLDQAGAANPKALAGAVVPGLLGMLAAHVVGKTPDLQLNLKDAGAESDIVPKNEGHFNEDRKFKKVKDILENR
jgi:hypothetical protein